MSPNNDVPKKIVAIKLRALGDNVLWTSALAALKSLYPKAQIDVVALEASRALLEHHPLVHRFFGLPKRDGWPLLKLFWRLRRERYDLALAFHANTSLCRWLFLVGAQKKAAHHHSWKYTPKTSDFRLEHPGAHQNAIEKDYEILRALGWKGTPLPTSLAVSAEAAGSAEQLLQANGLTGQKERLVLLPGAAEKLRRYPKEKCEQILLSLQQTGRFEIALLADRALAEEWHLREWADRLRIPLIEGLSLKDFVSVLSRFQIAIANDSGPGHMAVALGLRSVHIFGKGSFGDFYPYSGAGHSYVRAQVDCRSEGPRDLERFQFCTVSECTHLSCLNKISPEEIVQATLAVVR